ncbi:20169_t:CDS:2 [Gigaspora margarita]|uniref:20169_t:CDS:1 n=1 Tax=Gigaspora margarita TaxID=4874 RepID=A0ABN7V7U1_GIGMA|nr:20169_t:CDS:2 [Gigaspora margarita]
MLSKRKYLNECLWERKLIEKMIVAEKGSRWENEYRENECVDINPKYL